jgi:glycosyltransferase involved in cell wall biosynthesis
MSHRPLISVIMPTYNAVPGYLASAVASVRAQTWRNWELVIVDDGSTNGAAAVIAALAGDEPRIRTLRHPNNRALPAALNTGLRAARGELLTWLSDDDVLRPEALERMVAHLVARPDLGLVYTDFSTIGADGETLEHVRVGTTRDLGIRKPVGICHLGWRRVFDALGGYDEGFFLAEDLDFWIRACMRFRAGPLHQELACYRQHPATLTSSHKAARVLRVHGRILDRHLHAMHWLDRSGQAHAYLRLGRRLLGHGDWAAGLRYLTRGVSRQPLAPVRLWLASRGVGGGP